MRILVAWPLLVVPVLLFAACGGDGDENNAEPMRCGGVHWNEAESRDSYTGCQGNAGSWTCECGVDAARAFQGETEVSAGASTCGGAVREACSMSLEAVVPCAGVSGNPGTCWHVTGEDGEVLADTFDCRCERGTAPTEVTGDSCLAVLNAECGE